MARTFAGVFLRAAGRARPCGSSAWQGGARGGSAKPRRAQHQGDGHRRRRTFVARFRDAAAAFERAAGQCHPRRQSSRRRGGPCPRSFFRFRSGRGGASFHRTFASRRRQLRSLRGRDTAATEFPADGQFDPLRPVHRAPRGRCDRRRIRSLGRRGDRRRFDPYLWNAAGPGDRRFTRRPRADFLPQARSRASFDRRPLHGGRRYARAPAWPANSGLARR